MHLIGQTPASLSQWLAEKGEPSYRSRQILKWLYLHHVTDPLLFSDLPITLREKIKAEFDTELNYPVQVSSSKDGTKKYLFKIAERKYIESAWIPDKTRSTLCVSTQVGCKMRCTFCMTGKQGFSGHLSSFDILNQYFSLPEKKNVTNLVYMGMGEPLDNLEEVLKSLEVITSPWGLGWSPRRVTVSTVGLWPQVKTYIEQTKCHLAISLHSPFESQRKELMPVENKAPISKLIQFLKTLNWYGQRRLSFEYIMFDNYNDTPRHVAALTKLLSGLKCRINLIRFHEVPGIPLRPSSDKKMEEFMLALNNKGIRTTIRASRGQDIQAACGLLSTMAQKNQGLLS